MQGRGINADDGTLVMIRKRVAACLTTLQSQGFVAGEGEVNRLYRLATS